MKTAQHLDFQPAAFPSIPPPDSRLDIELNILGYLLAFSDTPELAREVMEVCPPGVFASRAAKNIAEAICALVKDGKNPDGTSVTSLLRCTGKLSEIGGAVFLSTLIERGPDEILSKTSLMRAARHLAEDDLRAKAQIKIGSLLRDSQNPNTPVATLAESMRQVAAHLEGSSGQTLGHKPLAVDWASYSGADYLNVYPEPFQYLLKGAFLKGELGLISGPPGSGKGTFSLQMAAYMAAGLPVFDWWEVPEPVKVLYISAEDSQPVIHRRLHHALLKLPEEHRQEAAARIVAIPVRGRVNICQGERNAGISLTEHVADLKKIIGEFQPGLVILDTLSRFLGVDENDNPAMTAACGVVEEIMQEYGCNVILLHHVSKAAGDCVENEDELSKALNQTAIRGASSLAGAARFAVVFAPLGRKLAAEYLGDEAGEKAPGSYVAIRAAKKNIGAPEPRLHFARGEHGLLRRVEPVNATDAAEEDAHKLAEEVRRREEAGEPPLSVSKGGREAFSGWGDSRNKKATKKALEMGLLEEADKDRGNGKVLKSRQVPAGRDFGMFNY